MNKTIKIKHSGNLGDVFYSLAAMQSASILHDAKVVLFLELNRLVHYPKGFNHPLGNVMLNEFMYKMAKPLLKKVDFIEDVMTYKGAKVDYDFDLFRKTNFNFNAGDIKKWYLYAFPELQQHFHQYQLGLDHTIADEAQNYIILNRSERYNNPLIDYSILKDSKYLVIFVGTDNEFKLMEKQVPKIIQYKANNFLDLAELISDCRLFIGNQSMCYSIAETINAPRLLEVSPQCPNVITNGLEMFNQQGFMYALKTHNII